MWVYLARDSRIRDDSVSDSYCYIGISRSPFHRLFCQQNRVAGWKVGCKATKPIAPHWQLELVVGPFFDGGGCVFKHTWRRSSRRLARRVKQGIELAERENVRVYCRDTAFVVSLLG